MISILGIRGWEAEQDKMQSQLGTQCKPFFRLTTRNPLFRSKKCCILRFTFATILQIGIIATKMYASQRARERKSRRDPARKPERAPKSHREPQRFSLALYVSQNPCLAPAFQHFILVCWDAITIFFAKAANTYFRKPLSQPLEEMNKN